MRILITGSRDWTDKQLLANKLFEITGCYTKDEIVVVHGGCPTGADAMAEQLCQNYGIATEVYPADWNKHGKAAGPIRNQQMVDLGADICLAFPKGESRGTRHCMRAAEKAGIEVVNYGER